LNRFSISFGCVQVQPQGQPQQPSANVACGKANPREGCTQTKCG
jgi:hypothetical protein